MSTIFEADDVSLILKAVKAVHESLFNQGAVRVVTILKIDESKDKRGTIKQKMLSVI